MFGFWIVEQQRSGCDLSLAKMRLRTQRSVKSTTVFARYVICSYGAPAFGEVDILVRHYIHVPLGRGDESAGDAVGFEGK